MTQTTTSARFRRSERDKVIGGVAGGLGRYLGVDPVLVRLALAVAIFAGGIGLVVYVLAWIIVPADDDPELDRSTLALGGDVGRVVGGSLVVIAALAIFGDRWWGGDLLLPVALVGLGAWLLLRPDRRAAASEPGATASPDEESKHAVRAPAPAPTTADAVHPRLAPPPPRVTRTAPSGFPTARATTGLVALAAGGLFTAVANGADISVEAILQVCLVLCGLGLVVGAFTGRARSLIVLAVPLTMALAVATAVDVPLRGGVGERLHAPETLAELDDEYRLGVGEMVIDLRDLGDDLRGDDRRIEATIGIGALQVRLPEGVSVTGDARAQLGDVDVRGVRSSGIDAGRRIRITGGEGAGSLELDLRVGLGEVVVG